MCQIACLYTLNIKLEIKSKRIASVNGTTMHLRPSEIRYTQRTISVRFSKDSEHPNYQIGETLDDLLSGQLNIADIPLIKVFKEDGVWHTHDNRRLWVFKKLEELGECTKVPVQREVAAAKEKRTASNQGLKVTVRGDPGGELWKKKEASIGGKPKLHRGSPKSHNKTKSRRELKCESTEPMYSVDGHTEYSGESESECIADGKRHVIQQEIQQRKKKKL
ncbi:uncharacterized protein [Argopecten irradians]|uniref:uncharacterized protein n=1 Tax=Argopecten irradians TaxID=31199 RepID=UPI00371D3746